MISDPNVYVSVECVSRATAEGRGEDGPHAARQAQLGSHVGLPERPREISREISKGPPMQLGPGKDKGLTPHLPQVNSSKAQVPPGFANFQASGAIEH